MLAPEVDIKKVVERRVEVNHVQIPNATGFIVYSISKGIATTAGFVGIAIGVKLCIGEHTSKAEQQEQSKTLNHA